MLKDHPDALATFFRERNKQVMLHFYITLICLKELHLRWSTSTITPKNSVQADIQFAICQVDAYALSGTFAEGEEVAGQGRVVEPTLWLEFVRRWEDGRVLV